MSAIAFEIPDEVSEARDGILAFAKQEVLSRHERHAGHVAPHPKLLVGHVLVADAEVFFAVLVNNGR